MAVDFGSTNASRFYTVTDSDRLTLPNSDWFYAVCANSNDITSFPYFFSHGGTYGAANSINAFSSGGTGWRVKLGSLADVYWGAGAITNGKWGFFYVTRRAGNLYAGGGYCGEPSSITEGSGVAISSGYNPSGVLKIGQRSDLTSDETYGAQARISDVIFVPGYSLDTDKLGYLLRGNPLNNADWWDKRQFHAYFPYAKESLVDLTGRHALTRVGTGYIRGGTEKDSTFRRISEPVILAPLITSVGGSTYNVTISESVTPGETITESGIFIASSAESNNQVDSQTENTIINVTVSETNSSFEATGEISVIFESSSESVDISEVLNGSAVVLSNQDENNSQIDSQTETAILNSVVSETNSQNDAASETSLIGSTQIETNVVNSSTDETSILIDSQSESVTPAETIESSSGIFGAMLESNNISESISETALLNSIMAESNSQVDTISEIAIVIGTISESQQVDETLLEQAVFNVSVSESNSNTETVNGSSDNIGQISESNTISETILETSILNAIISETNTQQDIIISTGLFNRLVSESQSLNDIQVGTSSFVVNVSESNQIIMLTNGTIGVPDKIISTLTLTADYHVINITAKH